MLAFLRISPLGFYRMAINKYKERNRFSKILNGLFSATFHIYLN
tara:strand:+ start:395 stop:526 length:132 start_codon:yes stop_codon:yes gene_type:complete